MKLYKCDRCKSYVETIKNISYTKIFMNMFLFHYIREEKDLCIECFTQFITWMDSEIFILPKRFYNEKDKTIKEMKL